MTRDRYTIGANNGPPMESDKDTYDGGADGWVAVARAMRFHPLVGCGQSVAASDPSRGVWSRYEAWQDLIMECRYEPGQVMNGGKAIALLPGQLVGAVSYLGQRWNWTPKTVRLFLDRLEDEGMIEPGYGTEENAANSTKLNGASEIDDSKGKQKDKQEGKHKGKQARVLTICKYDIYQLSYRQQGQTEGQIKGQIKGQQYKEETNSITNSNTPLPPTNEVVAVGPQAGLPLDDPLTARSEKASATRRRNADRDAIVAEAHEVYNLAAKHWGFARCEVLSDERRRRLVKRVSDIGGIDNFRKALRSIGRDDFLMGRVMPKPGQKPFLLTIDRLMQADGGLGDVLARLLEMNGQTAVATSPNGKAWGWWNPNVEKYRTGFDAAYWRRRLDAVKPNGTWPWWDLGAPPGHPECIVHPDVVDERGLAEIYRGEVTHA